VFPPDYGCNEHVLLYKCTVQDLMCMWLPPKPPKTQMHGKALTLCSSPPPPPPSLPKTQDKPWKVFPPDYGCNEHVLLDKCTVQDLVYMWLAPAVLAFASLGLLALRARLEVHDEHRKGPLGRLSTRLLPPK
jgi:hypothetical protein